MDPVWLGLLLLSLPSCEQVAEEAAGRKQRQTQRKQEGRKQKQKEREQEGGSRGVGRGSRREEAEAEADEAGRRRQKLQQLLRRCGWT